MLLINYWISKFGEKAQLSYFVRVKCPQRYSRRCSYYICYEENFATQIRQLCRITIQNLDIHATK